MAMEKEEPRHIGFEIKQTSKMIHRYINKLAAVEHANEMTGTHAWILRYLWENRNREIFQKDIEKRFDINRSSATGLLKLMEKNGLITREPVPYDARLKRIVMTEKAISLHKSVKEDIDLAEERITKGISAEELELLRSVLSRIRDNLSSAKDMEE